jgi:hypothetical protein
MVISLTARHLTSHGAENSGSVDEGESFAGAAHPLAHSGINDEVYRQRFM